jgi:hypothetical protein
MTPPSLVRELAELDRQRVRLRSNRCFYVDPIPGNLR